MARSKVIRARIADDLAEASDKGISKKLLKTIIKERKLERDIAALHEVLEDDELSELAMLEEKLGEFANTALGAAAVRAAKGKTGDQVLAEVGA